jgi:hypothetical protein
MYPGGLVREPYSYLVPGPKDCSKIPAQYCTVQPAHARFGSEQSLLYRLLNGKLGHSFTLINYAEKFSSFPSLLLFIKESPTSVPELCYFKPHLAAPHHNEARHQS